MTDGYTAPLGPVTQEPDMNIVKQVFDNALNAIVEASKLAKEVATLRSEFDSLRREMEALRADKKWLDEQLFNVRQQRDQASQSLTEAKHELESVKIALTDAHAQVDSQASLIEGLRKDLEQAKKEAADWMQSYDKAEAEKEKAQNQLKGIEIHMSTVLDLIKPKAPELGQAQAEIIPLPTAGYDNPKQEVEQPKHEWDSPKYDAPNRW